MVLSSANWVELGAVTITGDDVGKLMLVSVMAVFVIAPTIGLVVAVLLARKNHDDHEP